MNLADYLSDLLGQRDEVSVQGLGYFTRTRINAGYNDTDGRFYPPYHQVKFVPQTKDNEIFAQYVADEKNISLASSKYFVEKFVAKIKEDAGKGRYLFAGLGSFQTETDELVFKPNDRIPADPAFYGYPLIDILKPSPPLATDQKIPVFTEAERAPAPPPAEVLLTATPAVPQTEYFEEETVRKRGVRNWVIVLIALAIIALSVAGVYKFYPASFNSVKQAIHNITNTTPAAPIVHHRLKQVNTDTAKKVTSVKDTVAKTGAAAADTVKPARFEAISDEFWHGHLWKANLRVARLKAKGYNAYIVLDAPGPLIKVSVGAFPTYAQADSVTLAMLKAHKIKKHYIPIELKYK